MKQFIIICVVLAALFACSPSRNSSTQLRSLNGEWVLTVFPNATKPFAELFSMKTPELQFAVGDKQVSGTTGCNRIMGGFSVDGEEFKFGNLATTRMGCPGYDESIYLGALNRVNRFRLNADQLSLFQDSTLLMTFVKKSATGS